ncbi:MAG: anaerobic ribonucleoside-triphosphate reductase activating protein [Paludibacteraceae bacterium]|nr:anaerobic ribonucleoside-triphosphate reductase activating protein [Paludibacteraceae bacterium]
MLKYVNTGVVFQEIPDEVTLSINISNCPCHCPGCHSKYLWGDVGSVLDFCAIDSFIAKYGADITCVCFMGGDAEPLSVCHLAEHIHAKYPHIKVAWYSGRQRIPAHIDKNKFDYIKIGPYLAHLGSLKSRTTNQHLYKKVKDGFLDITSRFWRS